MSRVFSKVDRVELVLIGMFQSLQPINTWIFHEYLDISQIFNGYIWMFLGYFLDISGNKKKLSGEIKNPLVSLMFFVCIHGPTFEELKCVLVLPPAFFKLV